VLGYAPRDIGGHLRGAQANVRRLFPEMRGSIREFLLGQKSVSACVLHAPADCWYNPSRAEFSGSKGGKAGGKADDIKPAGVR